MSAPARHELGLMIQTKDYDPAGNTQGRTHEARGTDLEKTCSRSALTRKPTSPRCINLSGHTSAELFAAVMKVGERQGCEEA